MHAQRETCYHTMMTMTAVYQQQQAIAKRTRSTSVTKAAAAALAIAAMASVLSPGTLVVVGSSVTGGGSGLATTNDTFIPKRLTYK